MSVVLSLKSADLDEEDMQKLTSDLCRTIDKETPIDARIAESQSEVGSKGVPIIIGTIILGAIKSGAIGSLFQILKSYIERKPTLEMEFECPDGRKWKISASNLTNEQIERTKEFARENCFETKR
jgi:hypothetical protein